METITIRLGSSRTIAVARGCVVIIEDDRGAYGAVVQGLDDLFATLTFVPPGRPARIPLGQIVCATRRCVDPQSVPRDQPASTTLPRLP